MRRKAPKEIKRSFVYKIERLHRPEARRKEEGRRRSANKKRIGAVILRRAAPTLDFRRDKLTEAYDTSRPLSNNARTWSSLQGWHGGAELAETKDQEGRPESTPKPV
ncbi:hypothetical protein ANTRET_LOCUS5150 [Anthophora retusa]